MCSFSKRLGNCAVYLMRQDFFKSKPLMSSAQLDSKLKELYPKDYKGMPSAASAQRIGQVCREQFSSFLAASAKYEVDPSSFSGKPRLPGYSNKYRIFYVSRNGFKVKDGNLILSGGKKFGLQPIKITTCTVDCHLEANSHRYRAFCLFMALMITTKSLRVIAGTAQRAVLGGCLLKGGTRPYRSKDYLLPKSTFQC